MELPKTVADTLKHMLWPFRMHKADLTKDKPTWLLQRSTLDLHGYRRFGRLGLVPVP